MLGLHCVCGLSLVAASWGYSLVAVCGFLMEVASLLWSTGFRYMGFSSCSVACGIFPD